MRAEAERIRFIPATIAHASFYALWIVAALPHGEAREHKAAIIDKRQLARGTHERRMSRGPHHVHADQSAQETFKLAHHS